MKNPAITTTLALTALITTAAARDAASAPNADQILRQMSAKLAAARQFTFKAHRQVDGNLIGNGMPQDARIEVAVSRPDKILTKASGGKGAKSLYADGQNMTLQDPKQNLYATVPMRTSIDGLVERLDEKYGFTPPIAEFVLSDPYNKGFKQAASRVTYAGRQTLSSGFLGLKKTECHHLKLIGKMADAELWVGVADQLPKTLIATFKDRPGQPGLRIDFSDWNMAASVNSGAFTFVPPRGAMKIPMKTTSEMETPARKGARK